MIELWVDDEKPAPPGVEAITSYHDALQRLLAGGVDVLYLDFALGHISWTGVGLLKDLVAGGGAIPPIVRPISSSPSCNRAISEAANRLRAAAVKS